MAHAVDVTFQRFVVGEGHARGKIFVAAQAVVAVAFAPSRAGGTAHQPSQDGALELFGVIGVTVDGGHAAREEGTDEGGEIHGWECVR